MKRRIRYRRGPRSISVSVPAELISPMCVACNKIFEGRQMNTHHWREEFSFGEVKANPFLVLRNSIRVDVLHHRVANDLRGIVEQLQRGHITPEQIGRLIASMPRDMKAVFLDLAQYLSRRKLDD